MSAEQAPESGFQVKWELTGHGWARCRLAEGAKEVSLVAGYCTDALADLVAGAGGVYGEPRTVRFFFDAEPRELRWTLRATGERVEVTVRGFDDIGVSPDLPDSEGEVIWRSTHPRAVFVHAVLDAARHVLAEHGEAGYRATWAEHPYPVALVQDLRRHHLRDDDCTLPHDLVRP
ncbi:MULTISPECIES: hypothetical protein [unclassified Streptomyces]|uniref:hypothetical protein n=1 Tax=unclassified Streptomyces TaxID=2593676 RepID=UPI00332AA4EB